MKARMIHSTGSESKACYKFCTEDYNSEMVQQLQFPLTFVLKVISQSVSHAWVYSLSFKIICGTKKEKLLNSSEFLSVWPNLLGLGSK